MGQPHSTRRTHEVILEGSPDRYRECMNRTISLIGQVDLVLDLELLDEAIELAREALALSQGDAYRIGESLKLSSSLLRHVEHHSDHHGQDRAINLEREALALCSEEHPNRAQSCTDLAKLLWTRYERTGDDTLLDEAIDLQRNVVALRPQGHPEYDLSCVNLATLLCTRYQRTGEETLIDEAIVLQREALALCPLDNLDRAGCCGNLGGSLRIRYKHTGDDALLNESIDLDREALAICPERHPDRSTYCGNLALSLEMRYQCTGDDALLDEATALQREALGLCPQGHPDRAAACTNLTGSLATRYERTGNDALLDEAISLEREALALRPEEHPDHILLCGSLASLLFIRYQRTGDDGLLDEAINLQREALALVPHGHPYRSTHCGNLALSLERRHQCTGDDALLVEAINLQRGVVALRPQGHPDRAVSCGNLALSLETHYQRTGDDALLDESILYQREALALSPQGHIYRAVSCGNLAGLLKTCYVRSSDDRFLQEIFSLSHEAQSIAPPRTVWRYLCQLFWVHLRRTSSFYDVRKAIQYLSHSLAYEVDDVSSAVSVFSKSLGILWSYDAEIKHADLTEIYRRLVGLLPLLANSALDIQPQLQAIKGCSHIGSDAFVNAALAENSAIGLELLELAQGVIWAQGFHYRDPQLQDVPERLAKQLEDHLRGLAMRSAVESHDGGQWSAPTPSDIVHLHSSGAYALMREIRALPGLDRFMSGETFEVLRTTASNHPVVVLVGARGHYYALIVASSLALGHTLLPLQLTVEDVQNFSISHISLRLQRCGAAAKGNQPEVQRMSFSVSARRRSGPLDRLLKALWYKIVKPVLDILQFQPSKGRDRRRLHWCPTGFFATLPLHAAGLYDIPMKICCADFVISSYCPTVTALLRAQKASSRLGRDDLSIALVAEKQAHGLHSEVIYGVEEEIKHVAAVAKSSNVRVIYEQAGSTTVEETACVMEAANILHIACHGVQDIGSATDSGFYLGDGRLTIAKLMELKLDHAFLAFLSACETAKGDQEQPDQVMHLAAAMLFSGFKSVVATMWAIADDDGPKVAKWFYQELLAEEVVDVESVAYALDLAIGKLRDSGVSPLRWVPFIHVGA